MKRWFVIEQEVIVEWQETILYIMPTRRGGSTRNLQSAFNGCCFFNVKEAVIFISNSKSAYLFAAVFEAAAISFKKTC